MKITPDSEVHAVLAELMTREVKGQDKQPVLDEVAQIWSACGQENYQVSLIKVEARDVGLTLRQLGEYLGKDQAAPLAQVLLGDTAVALGRMAKAAYETLPLDTREEQWGPLCKAMAESTEFGIQSEEPAPHHEQKIIRRRWRP